MKKYYKIICAVVFAILTPLSFLTQASIPDVWRESASQVFAGKFFEATEPIGLIGTLLACFFFIFYRKTIFSTEYSKPVYISWIVFSALISACMLIATSFMAFDSLDFMLANRFQVGFSFLLLVGYIPFFYALIGLIFDFADRMMQRPPKLKSSNGLTEFIFDRKPILIPFIIFLVCWSPYWILNFPGTVPIDAFSQFGYYFGDHAWTEQHPVFSTLVIGFLMEVGRNLVNDNFGVFLITLYQNVITAFVCAFAIRTISKWKAPNAIRIFTLLFMALNPLIAYWPSTVSKNTSSAAFFVLFAILYLEYILLIKEKKPYIKTLIIAALIGILASLFRHDFMYVVSASLVFLVIINQPWKKRIVPVAGGIICFIALTLITNLMIETFNVEPWPATSKPSIPFQQTARTVRDHGDDVRQWERDAIDAIVDFDSLPERYRSGNADKVMFDASKIEEDVLNEYYRAWFSMMKRHPLTYIEATLGNTYAYYSPNGESREKPMVYIFTDIWTGNVDKYDIYYLFSSKDTIQTFYEVVLTPMHVPGPNVFYHLGNYTWFLLLLILGLFYKKKRLYILGFVPSLLVILTCLASPINGNYRYFIPVMMMIPVLLAWAIYVVYQKRASNEKNDENIIK